MSGTFTDTVMKILVEDSFAHISNMKDRAENMIRLDHDKKQLYYSIINTSSRKNFLFLQWIIDLMKLWKKRKYNIKAFPGIVIYTDTINRVCDVYSWIERRAPKRFKKFISKFHANITDEENRRKKIKDFISPDGSIAILTSTISSTGTGLDKPDIRFNIIVGLPKNIEYYLQVKYIFFISL